MHVLLAYTGHSHLWVIITLQTECPQQSFDNNHTKTHWYSRIVTPHQHLHNISPYRSIRIELSMYTCEHCIYNKENCTPHTHTLHGERVQEHKLGFLWTLYPKVGYMEPSLLDPQLTSMQCYASGGGSSRTCSITCRTHLASVSSHDTTKLADRIWLQSLVKLL